ncbi:hypothetical protein [Brevibacillus choshinensis]|uniref:hypothetical protein n=1 Tax=Brevibacillus choshinensis TaxID=54911 RepID=UPI002E20CCBE|nr:hypothetical protein [Brevibacillus choshinensis]
MRVFKEANLKISDTLKFSSILYLWTEKGALVLTIESNQGGSVQESVPGCEAVNLIYPAVVDWLKKYM